MKVKELIAEEKKEKEVRPETKVLRVVREVAREFKLPENSREQKTFFDLLNFGAASGPKQYPKWGLWAFEFEFHTIDEIQGDIEVDFLDDDGDDEDIQAAAARVKKNPSKDWREGIKEIVRAVAEKFPDFVGVSYNDKTYGGPRGVTVTYKYKQEDIIPYKLFLKGTPIQEQGSYRLWFKLDTNAPHMHPKYGDMNRITPSKLEKAVGNAVQPILNDMDSKLKMIQSHHFGARKAEGQFQIIYGNVWEELTKRFPNRREVTPDMDAKAESVPKGLLEKLKRAIEADPEFKSLQVPNARFDITLEVKDLELVPYWAQKWNKETQQPEKQDPFKYEALIIDFVPQKK